MTFRFIQKFNQIRHLTFIFCSLKRQIISEERKMPILSNKGFSWNKNYQKFLANNSIVWKSIKSVGIIDLGDRDNIFKIRHHIFITMLGFKWRSKIIDRLGIEFWLIHWFDYQCDTDNERKYGIKFENSNMQARLMLFW